MILGAISSVTDYAVMYRYSAGFMVLFVVLYVIVQFVISPRLSHRDRAAANYASSSNVAADQD
ncbi:hypothetical protein [Fontibacillus panacisegetis]|uniref:hypothetical protein n=1 Tax=Fontibacillus panacisegetis TaxID=670482 RepID=UPI001FE18E8F|nr:hypothetical protein [Fontibacillus panacisegetis]